ncbi:MAG TPA: hypothetical protein VFN09_13250 [Rhodanobacteraceae bacterium]|nr:hypothetical protein [Rhodanobacteraceae bacterium]
MQRHILFTLVLALASFTASAGFPEDHALFGDGFDPPAITPQFERAGDAWVLPTDPSAGPAIAQARWLMSELAAGQTTSAARLQRAE